ncbi:MAG: coproporphyrinogen dehydrogenase HemZ [Ruthenibacterium sp.]
MQIWVAGYKSAYELEHVARLFFPAADLAPRYPAGKPDAIVVRLSKTQMLCAFRQNGRCVMRKVPRPAQTEKTEYAHAKLLFLLLCDAVGTRPAWGMLTGVRPVHWMHDLHAKGMDDAAVARFMVDDYFVSPKKQALAAQIAQIQKPILAGNTPRDYSLYISIPFCPSRCSYCSFVSRTTAESGAQIAPYVDALCKELVAIKTLAQTIGLRLRTIYIGGGTPTAISAPQLRQLMQTVRENFDISAVQEYTVEAGRPDCTTIEKLRIIKEYGATRISINPQTLSDTVLAAIGRKHTAQDILTCYENARAVGHHNINMDLIAGLPLDTPASFEKSLVGVMALAPENITVHTLTLKRASSLVIDHAARQYGDAAAMVDTAQALLAERYQPYYLYRQKGTLQNLENTGYTLPAFAGLYNVYIMEEVHTILSAGAGGSTKLVEHLQQGGARIERIFNHKYPIEYLKHFDAVMRRKEGVNTFYGKCTNLDSETAR